MEEEQMELSTMIHIPNDIIMNILSRLPSKSLKRIKCGGKYLFNIIEDPTFIKMHLHHLSNLPTNNPYVLISNPQGNVYSFNSRDVVSSLLPKIVEMGGHSNLPFMYPHGGFDILGHCNGLLCLLCEGGFHDDDCVYFLWNPFMGESKMLPHDSSYKYPVGVGLDHKLNFYGFCYDHTIDDYKVIKNVHYFAKDVSIVEVNVYTLRSNSWNKKIKTSPLVNCCWDMQFSSGLFVHGALHWIMLRFSASGVAKIISFDIVKEEYRVMQLPDSMDVSSTFDVSSFHGICITLQVLNGCFCIFFTGLDHKFLEVWMMKEYNVKKSWTKLFHIDMQPLNLQNDLHGPGAAMPSNLKPLMYCKDGEVLVVWGGIYLVLYDPKKNEARCVCKIEDHVENGFLEETYIESLVSLKDQTDGSKKNIPRRRTSLLVVLVSIFSFFLVILWLLF